jgi:hypothetical protein
VLNIFHLQNAIALLSHMLLSIVQDKTYD